MADIMMKIKQDKMALKCLIVVVFRSLNMEIEALFSSESAGVFSFTFGHAVKKLLANKHWHFFYLYGNSFF